ncbi:MAG: phage tail protein [Epsilonproteobacteria bacterium]|nr:phage tail protein [Campylobacterota bacterium]
MALNYGINGLISVQAARPIAVESSTPIGMAVTSNGSESGFIKFNNAEEGLRWCDDNGVTDGTILGALHGIFLQGVSNPIVAYIVKKEDDDSKNRDNISKAIEEFTKAYTITGVKPKLLIAPGYSYDVGVAAKIDAIASKMWATGIVCSYANSEAESNDYIANFGTRFLLITNGVSIVDGVEISNDVATAGLIAYWDAGGDNGFDPFGWAKNHSNRVVRGIEKSTRKDGSFIEYVPTGDCEARRLRQKGMAHIVRDEGWRLYGFETTDIDPIWASLDRVRTFYRLLETIIDSIKWARDREADQLVWVKKSIEEFFRELKGNNVVIGFEVFFDPQKNTKATVSAGKFYLTIKTQDMPSIRELNIELVYVDDYSDVLINFLNGEGEL